MTVTLEEFESLKSLANVSEVRFDQVTNVIRRITQCKKRLQLRFPSVFRDGVLLQYLTKFIKSNPNIVHFACGLSTNYSPGFYALNEILALKQIKRFNLRINDLSFASLDFFETISQSNMCQLYLKIDEINDEKMKFLSSSLQQIKTLKHLTFSCQSLTDASAEYLAQFCANNVLHTLSISMDLVTLKQVELICAGLQQSNCIHHLDVEDCKLNFNGMKHLAQTLQTCANIKALTIGNNGYNAMSAFFEEFGALQYIERLICNECQLIRAEHVNLDMISTSLNKINTFNTLSMIQMPLFIFDDTSTACMDRFVEALSNADNQVEILQIFPLFEHLDRASIGTDPAYCDKISRFFDSLFKRLAHNKSLKKLYIEMIGSEINFFTPTVAESFLYFMENTAINELYAPFCHLIDLDERVLECLTHCHTLVAIQDDTLDYQWLDHQTTNGSIRYEIDEQKRAELLKAKKYHQIAHKHCQSNISKELAQFVGIPDVADLMSTFCGFEANPHYWIADNHDIYI